MTTANTFLPKNFKIPDAGNAFFKFKEGDNKFRVLTDAVIGVEGWRDGTPFRRIGPDATIAEDEVDIDEKYGKPKINHFWAFMVWSYREEKVMLCQINQKNIQKAILQYAQDKEWGSPKNYDITVTRVEGAKVSYQVKPSPAKPLKADIQKLVDEAAPTFDVHKALGV